MFICFLQSVLKYSDDSSLMIKSNQVVHLLVWEYLDSKDSPEDPADKLTHVNVLFQHPQPCPDLI